MAKEETDALHKWENETEITISMEQEWGTNRIYRDCLRLEVCSGLRRLHLVHVGINEANVGAIVTLLIMHRSLQELDVSHNQLGDDGTAQLAVVTCYRPLRRLCLADNNITDKGACQLARYTQTPQLELQFNQIGDIGVKDLVQKNRYIQELDLAHNRITDHGVQAIATSSTDSQLVRLVLRGNPGITTAQPLLTALQQQQQQQQGAAAASQTTTTFPLLRELILTPNTSIPETEQPVLLAILRLTRRGDGYGPIANYRPQASRLWAASFGGRPLSSPQ